MDRGSACGGGCPLGAQAAPAGIGRRSFVVQAAMMAAAAALAACGASGDATAPSISTSTGNTGGSTSGGTSGASANVLTVANYPALASVGGVAVLSIGNAPIAVVRTGASTFLAFSRVCPHQGGIVEQSGSYFRCPIHGATFSTTGAWVGGQPTSSLHQYNAAYDATAGTLTIT